MATAPKSCITVLALSQTFRSKATAVLIEDIRLRVWCRLSLLQRGLYFDELRQKRQQVKLVHVTKRSGNRLRTSFFFFSDLSSPSFNCASTRFL